MKIIRQVDSAKIVEKLLKTVAAKHVIDTTFGVGRFYKYYKPKLLVGIDPNIYEEYVVKPDIFIPKPVWAAIYILEKINIDFDTLVTDPPFYKTRPRGKDKRTYFYNIIGTPDLILRKSIELAIKLDIEYILIHYGSEIEDILDKLLDSYEIIDKILYEYKAGFLNVKSFFYLIMIL